MKSALIDTDVLIDFLHGQSKALALIDSLDRFAISAISITELYAGVRLPDEARALERLLDMAWQMDVDPSIAKQAGDWQRKFKASHDLETPDALIAATAEHHSLTLLTLNVKHYPMFKGLKAAYKKN